MNNSTRFYPSLPTRTTGQNLASHVGLSTLTGLLNTIGYQALATDRLSQFTSATATHKAGKIITDLALSMAAGGEQVADADQLRQHPEIFGPVASEATFSRFFTHAARHVDSFEYAFATLCRALRTRLWAVAGTRNPGAWATARNPLV